MSVWESWITEQLFNGVLNRVDQICEVEVSKLEDQALRDAQKHHATQTTPQAITETAGIPTGIAADIELQIIKRRKRQALTGEDLA